MWMKIIVPLIVGLLISAFMGIGGFILGCLVGFLLWEYREHAIRVAGLERRIADLQSQVSGLREEVSRAAPREEPEAETTEEEFEETVRASEQPEIQPAEAPHFERPAQPAPDRAPVPPAPSGPREADERILHVIGQIRTFFFGGNTLVRTGLLVLFFGFAFLVRYAVENDFFPLSLRLAATAVAGIAITGTGWRLRTRRPDFALALQGGGIAVLYLTIFAAFRLYGLIPGGFAFGLLVTTTVLGAILALLQNAQSLAILSLLGGFFAPVLTSTGEGSHVALFSYYAVLNAGVFTLAWFRRWRPVHLTGFFCTFGIAGLWVTQQYDPSFFATSEPFLILFFLCYFAITILHARHQSPRLTNAVDGTLVFGLPVVVFSLQAGLVDPFEYGLAWSAFGFGLFYAIAAYVLYVRAREVLRVLVESFAGIGLVLGTMVLPFALDASWTGTGWALEGMGLVWLGFRQRRVLLRLSGMLLQVAGGISFLYGFNLFDNGLLPVVNRYFSGFLALAISASVTAYLINRHRDQTRSWEVPMEFLFLTAGTIWWLIGGIIEIGREIEDVVGYHIVVVFVSLTAVLAAVLRGILDWRALRVPALLLLPALVILLAIDRAVVDHPFEAGGYAAWPLAWLAYLFILRRTDTAVSVPVARLVHAGTLWLLALILVPEVNWIAGVYAPPGSVWSFLANILVPALVVLLVVQLVRGETWPAGMWRRGYLFEGAVPLLIIVWYWSIHASLTLTADPAPLQYLPVLNPLDVVFGLAVIAGVLWYRAGRQLVPEVDLRALRTMMLWVLTGTAFLWLNAVIARTVHFWGNVPYRPDYLYASTAFQTALTIFWTLLSVVTMAVAARRGARIPWIVAAILLGVTVIKLFVIDLSQITTVARIVTFIVVGLLLLLVGYLAPVPPQRRAPELNPDEETAPVT